jgi:membrane protease YdiL (CAAX protease family)
MIQFLAVALWYFVKADKSNVRNIFSSYGLKWEGKLSRKSLLRGFLITFVILALLVVLEAFLGAREFKLNIKSKWPLQIIEYICAAFIIGFIEEFFFRGMVFQKARKVSLLWAFFFTNSFYSIVHFLKAKHVLIGETASVKDSLRVIGGLLEPLADPIAILPGFIGLLIFGLLLSYCYWRTSSLYYSIGIHAGAVFFLKIDGFFLHINPDAPVFIFGDKNVYTGILGWFFILIIGCILHVIISREKTRV